MKSTSPATFVGYALARWQADGFAHQVFGQAVGQQTKSFLGGGKDTPLIRRTCTGAVPGIFENIHVNRRGILDGAGEISAVNGTTGIAVRYQNARDR
jgi:hypothetical protein